MEPKLVVMYSTISDRWMWAYRITGAPVSETGIPVGQGEALVINMPSCWQSSPR